VTYQLTLTSGTDTRGLESRTESKEIEDLTRTNVERETRHEERAHGFLLGLALHHERAATIVVVVELPTATATAAAAAATTAANATTTVVVIVTMRSNMEVRQRCNCMKPTRIHTHTRIKRVSNGTHARSLSRALTRCVSDGIWLRNQTLALMSVSEQEDHTSRSTDHQRSRSRE